MERGRVGERYILGGTNATILEVLTTLAEITGLRGPGFEGRLTWFVGVNDRTAFRVIRLDDPPRLVVDSASR